MSYHAACKDVSIDDPKSIELTADLFSEYFFKIIGGVARAHVSKTAPDIEPSKRLGLQGLLLLLILLHYCWLGSGWVWDDELAR